MHPGPERSSQRTTSRWTLVCRDYRGIQERVVNNGMVMRETQIQLPEINQTTLSQWYIKRQKKKEQDLLKQGLPQPTAAAAASKTPLPEAIPLPPSLPQVNFPVPFNFALPTNTTGTAVLRGPSSKRCSPIPILPAPVPFLQPPTVVRSLHPVPIQPKIQTPHQQPQQPNQSQKQEPQSQPQQNPRSTQEHKVSSSQKRSLYDMICTKCGKKRDPESHKQYFGNWYCNTMTESFETWRENLKKSKGYKKKKPV